MKKNIQLLLCLLTFVSFFSCVPIQKLKYAQDDKDAKEIQNTFTNIRSTKTIQPYDKLYIQIYSLDEKTMQVFNSRESSYSTSLELISYTVDEKGYIHFPFIDNIYVQGLTINEAKEKIESSLKQYLIDISVIVRFVGNKITVLGEVRAPGEYAFYDEKINIYEAIGFSGGVDDYGNKSNITLVREFNNQISYYKLDLTRKDFATSEFYYLLPNDVIIIEPIKSKYRYLRNYGLATTVLSSVLTIVTTINIIDQLNK